MKKIFFIVCIVAMSLVSCSKFDDVALWNKSMDMDSRISDLEALCRQLNGEIQSLQTLIEAVQNNDYVTSVVPVMQDGVEIGYTITFSKSTPVTIYHGKDGQNGKDGAAGKDGYTPKIGIKQDTDGIYYWTLDGEWLTDGSGNKIKAEGKDGAKGNNGDNGKDGVTPQLKIEDGYWYVSHNNGESWQQLGKATGEDGKNGTNGENGAAGKDGDSFFKSVDNSNPDYIIFTLSDGTEIKIPTWYAFEQLKKLCQQMNSNIESLQTIVEAMEAGDYIISCTPLMEDGKQVGYTITFSKSGSIVIYHGKDGKDGENGKDGTNGKDGENGANGHTPQIGVKEYEGVLYWTVDGEFLTDDAGQKIPVTGKDGVDGKDGQNGTDGKDGKDGADGITPQLKIEDGDWWVSTDNGQTWQNLGKATGDNGKDGDSIFEDVHEDEYYIYITLTGRDDEIAIPKNKPFEITFAGEEFKVQPGLTYTLNYTIKGGDANTQLNIYEKNGLKATIRKSSDTAGTIDVVMPNAMTSNSIHELIVLVNDGYDRTLMKTLTFVKGIGRVTNYLTVVNNNETQANVILATNLDAYTVEIPSDARNWLSLAPATRAEMKQEAVRFTLQPNTSGTYRSAIVKIVDTDGNGLETIQVIQRGANAKAVQVTTAGRLSSLIGSTEKNTIEELTVTGKLNSTDYTYIKGMTGLKYLDLSDLDDTTLPTAGNDQSGCFYGSGYIKTLILPKKLTSIPAYSFVSARIEYIDIPETVTSIGEKAFFNCTNWKGSLVLPKNLKTIGESAFLLCSGLTGNLIIPDAVTTIGNYAFVGCTGFTGDLVIGQSVTSIGSSAFIQGRYAFSGNGYIPYIVDGCKKLYFSGVFCKAVAAPKIATETDVNESLYRYYYPSFGDFTTNGRFPTYLGVKKGCLATYLQSDWDIFPMIEEVDFDALGY